MDSIWNRTGFQIIGVSIVQGKFTLVESLEHLKVSTLSRCPLFRVTTREGSTVYALQSEDSTYCVTPVTPIGQYYMTEVVCLYYQPICSIHDVTCHSLHMRNACTVGSNTMEDLTTQPEGMIEGWHNHVPPLIVNDILTQTDRQTDRQMHVVRATYLAEQQESVFR